MQTISTISALRGELASQRHGGKTIAFVPTMGALHDGHLALVDIARAKAGAVVMSIFVNPLQFGPREDFARYPRSLESDAALAEAREVDILFAPGTEEMYPSPQEILVTGGALGKDWEGATRPGHFDGMLTVVAKLFNAVQPDFAVFGQKDLQQLALVRAMTRDLGFPIEIVPAPIQRDSSGLALSSRNQYLSADEKESALSLSRALEAMGAEFIAGERSSTKLERTGREVLSQAGGVTLDYLAIVDPATFRRAHSAGAGSAAIVAAQVGKTRLIDNVIFSA